MLASLDSQAKKFGAASGALEVFWGFGVLGASLKPQNPKTLNQKLALSDKIKFLPGATKPEL